MAYVKTEWKDFPSEDTPITASALNNIEDGVEDLDTRLTTAEGEIDNLQTDVDNLQTDVDNLQTDVDNLQNSSKVLYDNPSGTTGTVILNEPASNFTYLQISYRTNNNSYDCVTIYDPNGKQATLSWNGWIDEPTVSYMQVLTEAISITGVNITRNSCFYGNMANNGNIYTGNFTGGFYIEKVVGYR